MTPLCTLAQVKRYLDIPPTTTTGDAVLSSLITLVSALAPNQANSPDREDGEDPTLFEDDYREQYDGHGTVVLLLRHSAPTTPVARVRALTIDGLPVPKSPGAPLPGFMWDRFSVRLRGYRFLRGQQNVVVTYTAGHDPSGATGLALAGAAAEWVAEVYKQRPHIDVRAKTLDRETVSFLAELMPLRMTALLTNLKNRMAA